MQDAFLLALCAHPHAITACVFLPLAPLDYELCPWLVPGIQSALITF